MTWNDLVALGLELPEVELGTWYGTPALKVRKKGFVRLKEDGASVVFHVEDLDVQRLLVEAKPAIYFVTPHYEGWPMVLARLSALRAAEARERLEESWRQKAPKTLVAKLDASRRAR